MPRLPTVSITLYLHCRNTSNPSNCVWGKQDKIKIIHIISSEIHRCLNIIDIGSFFASLKAAALITRMLNNNRKCKSIMLVYL